MTLCWNNQKLKDVNVVKLKHSKKLEKELQNGIGDGIIGIDSSQVLTLDTNIHEELAHFHLRWLKKKDGTRVLQQLFLVRDNTLKPFRQEWKNVEEVEE